MCTPEGEQPQPLSRTELMDLGESMTIAVDSATGQQVSCATCIGACCTAGMVLNLSGPEADYLRAQGTELEAYGPEPGFFARKLGRGMQQQRLATDCGNLQEDGRCGDYENRPQACREFVAARSGCLLVRASKGKVDLPMPQMPGLR